MRSDADAALSDDGFKPEAREFSFAADLRYVGQEHSVSLPVAEKLTQDELDRVSVAFAEAHERQYGHTMPDPVELVALRLTAVGRSDPPTLPTAEARTDGAPEPQGARQVRRPGGETVDYDLYLRQDLLAGDRIPGPVIIAEHTSTTVVHRDDEVEVGPHGELLIHIDARTDEEA